MGDFRERLLNRFSATSMSVGLWINIVFKDESKFAKNTFGIFILQ